jgi:hypothetical protein
MEVEGDENERHSTVTISGDIIDSDISPSIAIDPTIIGSTVSTVSTVATSPSKQPVSTYVYIYIHI